MSTKSALSDGMIAAGDRKVPRLVKLAYGLGGAVQNGGFDTAIGFTFSITLPSSGFQPRLSAWRSP